MKYWNEIDDLHLRFGNTDYYQKSPGLSGQINRQGYVGDILAPSEVVFLGACDVMSLVAQNNLRWSKLLHDNKYLSQPFIALGTVGTGMPTMVRKLYSYIQNFGAPKSLYMVVPRFDGYEYVNKSGKCYNVSTRTGTARFSKDKGLINNEELSVWLAQLSANKQLNNPNNIQYMLEERFAFIETMCKAYNINLRWTFNLTDASIVVLHNNLNAFKDISPFMKNAFAGLAQVKDQVHDRAIGVETHREIYEKFIGNETWDFDKLCRQSQVNLDWMNKNYSEHLIKGE